METKQAPWRRASAIRPPVIVKLLIPSAVGLGFGALLALPPTHPPTAAADRSVAAFSHGMDDPFAVELTPERSRTSAQGRGQMDYRVDIVAAAGMRTTAKVRYELATSRGELVSDGELPAQAADPAQSRHRAALSTPADLRDGYYVLRVAVAGSNGRGTNTRLEEQYLHMQGGQLSVIGFEEWSERSGVSHAHVIVSDVQPANEAEAREHFAAKPTAAPAP